MNRSPALTTLAIWLLASLVTVLAQLSTLPASYTPEGYVPYGNDGFYHARRILDTVENPGAFYEFDRRIHAPEGSQLTWPWGYDYVMAQVVRAGLVLGLADDPMTLLAYLPVAAVLVSMLLLLVIARSLELGPLPAAVVFFSVAVSPLVTNLHGVGRIDHHWAEFVLILAFIAAGQNWANKLDRPLGAMLVGGVLGVAPAIHNGLFVLQSALLVYLILRWFRTGLLPARAATSFAVALSASTLLVLIPSEPFRNGDFQYFLLSWFHLYVAGLTALCVFTMSRLQPTFRNAVRLGAAAVLLAVPLLTTVLQLGAWAVTSEPSLQEIAEAKSLFSIVQSQGFFVVIEYYTGLIALLPVVWAWSLWTLYRMPAVRGGLLLVYTVVFLPLMLVQFRLNYFGIPALFLVLALMLESFLRAERAAWVRLAVSALTGLALLPSIHHLMTYKESPGGELYYQISRAGALILTENCGSESPIVLARGNDGHYLRYHTGCAVMSNNFLLTRQHFDAYQRVNALFQLTPAELLQAAPEVELVFVRVRSALVQTSRGTEFVEREGAMRASSPLEGALLWSDPAALPPEFELLGEIPGPLDYPLVRVYRINRAATRSPAS